MTRPLTERTRRQPEWVFCEGCRSTVYGRRWARNLSVCPECGRHAPVDAPGRLAQLLDEGTSEPLAFDPPSRDILGFVDTVPYPRRLAAARAKTGLHEAVVCARGSIGGSPVVVAVMDFRFLGGSLGAAVGESITLAAETALAERVPLLIVTASGGARMQEGAIALMQMAKTATALARLDEAGVLTVSLITDPTYGGVAASFATLTDVIIAEPRARLGFAGRRVIEQTIGETLPPTFQRAEFLVQQGFVDLIAGRDALRGVLGSLLRTTEVPRMSPPRAKSAVLRDPGLVPTQPAWNAVRRAREIGRPTMTDYLAMICTDFVELHGDRISGDCAAVVTGTAVLEGRPVMMIGHQKGHTAAELTRTNFGMPLPAGYRKAARAMRLAAKLRLPVVTLVDTPGAFPGAAAEESGQAVAIAENLRLMASLPVPVVTVVTGEGGSGGALALAVANRVLVMANAVYSVISAEGCAAILWSDPAAAPRAAEALRCGARELLSHGIVDGVIPEPDGGTAAAPVAAADALRSAVLAELDSLSMLDGDGLVADRRARFRRFGTDPEAELILESEGAR